MLGRQAERSKGLTTASRTILGLVMLLLIMASISGGFRGLSGVGETLIYSVLVCIPLLLVIFISQRSNQSEKPDIPNVVTVAPDNELLRRAEPPVHSVTLECTRKDGMG